MWAIFLFSYAAHDRISTSSSIQAAHTERPLRNLWGGPEINLLVFGSIFDSFRNVWCQNCDHARSRRWVVCEIWWKSHLRMTLWFVRHAMTDRTKVSLVDRIQTRRQRTITNDTPHSNDELHRNSWSCEFQLNHWTFCPIRWTVKYRNFFFLFLFFSKAKLSVNGPKRVLTNSPICC